MVREPGAPKSPLEDTRSDSGAALSEPSSIEGVDQRDALDRPTANRTQRGPRVLVILDGGSAWSRGVLRGFFDVARTRHWTVLHYHPTADLAWLLEVWKPAVVVLQPSAYGGAERALARTKVVSVGEGGDREGASVRLDEVAIGRLAAEHLLGKGLRTVTTFRFNDGPLAVARELNFTRAARAMGADVAGGWWVDGADPPRSVEEPSTFVSWLHGLPKPCGVFACTDSWSRIVARYAEVSGVRVPEDLALIGVDNDTVDCELSMPPLTSVAIPWRTLGEHAADLVERALAGEPAEHVVVPPTDVIPRRSTEVAAVDDPLVAEAMSWIAEHAVKRLTLMTVSRALSTSRQRLELRFRAAVGRTVMQEVRRARVDVAKRLLSTTALPLPTVAQQSGFTSAALLNESFRRATGVPPGTYRRRLRGLHVKDE